MTTADDLLGAWELRSWIVRTPETGEAVYPLGEDARGRIHYAADGYMTASIARPGRAVPMNAEDARRILRNYMHYTGRWSFADNVVTHEVDYAVDPALVGRKLARKVQLSGNHLTLSGEDVSPRDGRHLLHVLEWRRAQT
ncbi:lipocalin-like domain-containing protein [Govanella unica]|uniref:Lipocalin-like domain-containing protein n=1 Tax=Govanella unica TaxID=2975056 RepID=A0A9X3TXC0_9PROT|nr:lipocalin-like domain-containing protein [Govania unica]MDA5193424.1 lipocalin-like domain-containing protein [Govania unica]